MKSLASSLIQGGWSKDGIHLEGLLKLEQLAIEAGHTDQLDVPGLTGDRKPVFAGGLSILLALFELFGIREMSVSDIALREGVLYDLVGRSSTEDIRYVTIAAMLNRWSVDVAHGNKVRDTALNLYQQTAHAWDISDSLFESTLGWSAQLHEIGLSISHDGYHKHGAYLVANGDMAGFARRDQLLLAALITGHRRKFPLGVFEELPATLVTPAKRVVVLLRLAVLLHRGRGQNKFESISVRAEGQQLYVEFEPGWLELNPLTEADLKQERTWLKGIGIKLLFK